MRSGWFDTLHPLTKLTWALCLAVSTYLINHPVITIAILSVALLTPLATMQPGTIYRALRTIFVPIALSLFLIQGILFPGDAVGTWQLFGMTINYGALQTAGILLARIMTMGSGLLCVILTTPPATLTHALAQRGMPRSIEYILLMALQIIPDMQARASAILESQQSRGLVIRSLPSRIRALLPLIGPLVVGALVDVEERAMALELRAFAAPNPPTRMQELIDSRRQHVARSGLLIGMLIIIGVRIWGGVQ
ncbi:MAG: energy-coupling factor transporter transmembrane component T family protein [Roseiflexaceae bacterium]